MPTLAEKAKTLLRKIEGQEDSNQAVLSEIAGRASALRKAANRIGESWSGSAFGYHWNLYYGDFEHPPLEDTFSVEWGGIQGLPPGWRARNPEEVKEQIEGPAGVDSSRLKEDTERLLDAAKKLQTELLVALAPLHDAKGFTKEKELLDKLENWDWMENSHTNYCAAAMNSFPHVSRDSGAVFQGMKLPTHTDYEAVAAQANAYCKIVQEFWSVSRRLLRQLESARERPPTSVSPQVKHDDGTLRKRYERLKYFNLTVAALLLGVGVYWTLPWVARQYQWQWLVNLSHGIRILGCLGVSLFLLGLFIPKFRSWSWGVGAFSILISVLQAIR